MAVTSERHYRLFRPRPLRFATQVDPSICAVCRSLLERPSITGHKDPLDYPFTFTLESISKQCPLCIKFRFYVNYEHMHNQLRFGIHETHSTCQESPPTGPTLSRIGVRRYDRREDHAYQDHSRWAAHLEVNDLADLLRQDDKPTPNFRPIISSSTGDQKALELVRRWMKRCSQDHKTCRTSVKHPSQQMVHSISRLISVEKRDRLRLIEPAQTKTSRRIRYATLTHKWGSKGLPLLTRANKDDLRKRISFLSLPPTFRDAIRVCQFLGIPYLWIDTLCIVQDDEIDKAHQIANMGQVYANACLNIGALGAAQKSRTKDMMGLFSERSKFAEHNNPICARVRRSDFDELCYIDTPSDQRSLGGYTLMSRGWVLQERLLSPCSVYFHCDQLLWECSELLASEFYPDGTHDIDIYHEPLSWGYSAPFRMGNLLSHSRDVSDGLSHVVQGSDWSSKYQCWMKLVEDFSRCDLTHSSDGLLAVSGLAKYFAQEFNDEYLAGLWEKDLFYELLWFRAAHTDRRGTGNDTQHCKAPTWSWAFKPFGVNFLFLSWHIVLGYFVQTAQILESTIVLQGNDPTGNVAEGHIILTGPMRKSKPRIRRCYDDPDDDFDWYDKPHKLHSDSKMNDDTYHFLMGYTSFHPEGFLMPSEWEGIRMQLKLGLIIEPVEDGSGTFKRVGAFAHPSSAVVAQYGVVLPPGEYEEFLSFDPNKYKCHTVKVV